MVCTSYLIEKAKVCRRLAKDTSADTSRQTIFLARRDEKKPPLLTNLKKTISDDISCEKTHASRKLIALRVEKRKHEKKVERPRAKFAQRKTHNEKQRTILQEKLTRRAALAGNIQHENDSGQRAGNFQQQASQPGHLQVPWHIQRAQHGEMARIQMQQQQNNFIEMTPEQTTQMDQATFPQSLLTNNSKVPKNITTWGQLKQWVSSNSQASTGINPNHLLTLQRLHFAQIISVQAKDPNRQNQGQGVMKGPSQQAPQD
ncbi:hypothetical protein N7509_001234 [Penicillium cosmopolitanum]|uniref:Uncharacterized protein n=1 Tax=Penicillium cosmopolitanum TaxID=1131564 RepID=A0A9W9WC37_9EURO|nr:uncharacterized protein N7509_001234 [Penicillium cosmopolitanum]KAJ5414607.1 hypothetical protein N7509_001234 [Penicillium cosmopolitanum]